MNQDRFRSQCLVALGITPWGLNAEYGEAKAAVVEKSDEAKWCLLGADSDSPLLQDLLLLLQCRQDEVTMVEEDHQMNQGQQLLSFGIKHEGATLSLPLWSALETAIGKRQTWTALQELL